MIKYGKVWPDDSNAASIERWCYINDLTTAKGGLGKAGHLKRLILALFPERDPFGRRVYVWHPWMDRRIQSWCDNKIITWWGPAASAKSTDAAMIALVDWYADPANTTTIICSTTLKMLRRRIFAEVVRFHKTLCLLSPNRPPPGNYVRSKDQFLFDPTSDDDQQSDRAGIFGFAIQQGDKKQAKDDIIGQHNQRVRIIIDEAQHPDMEVAFDARSNLAKGAEDFKLLGFGNPDSRLTPIGRYSEPKAGWDSISDALESWETKLGVCHYFDGLKSPAMQDPIRYSFLIKKQDVDDEIEDSGMNSPDYWQFARGFVRPEGTISQIISDTFALKTKMREEPQWIGGFEVGAGFDPSFSSGGDRRVLVPFQFGETTDQIMTLAFLKPIDIHVDMTQLYDKTFSRQMSEKVIGICQSLGVKKNHFGMDSTGAQMALADFIDEMWDEAGAIYRCEFGGKPSEDQATESDTRKASEVYANRVSELWFNMVAFAKSNQIRRIPIQALKEFTIREILSSDKLKLRTTKRQVETKTSMKERTGGRSPDEADACCVCIDTARARMGLKFSGKTVSGESRSKHVDVEYDEEYDLDASDKLYLTDAIPTV